MAFMEEQGMSRSHRFSTSELMALSGVPRAFEIFDETLGDEVKAELEAFAGNKTWPKSNLLYQLQVLGRYVIVASMRGLDLACVLGYELRHSSDSYPIVTAHLEAAPKAKEKETLVAAMKKISAREGWEAQDLANLNSYSRVLREKSLATFLGEEDHVAAVKRFFIESIGQLREGLTEFKKENPELPWSGGDSA